MHVICTTDTPQAHHASSVVTSYDLWWPFRCIWMIGRVFKCWYEVNEKGKRKKVSPENRHHHRHHRHIVCTTGTPQEHHAWSLVTSYDLWMPFRCTLMIWRSFKCWYVVNKMGKRKKVSPENPQAPPQASQARHMHHRHTTGTSCMICSYIIVPLKAI
jgi:hypothetical protein